MWYSQIQFKSHHLLTTLLTSSPIPSCSMFPNPAPLTSRAVVAVDVTHFILADHDLDVVVSIISEKKKFYFYAVIFSVTDLLMLSPPLDLLSTSGLRDSAVTSAMLGLLPRFTATLSDSAETAECLLMLYLTN